MKVSEMREVIMKMDVKSEEFYELYKDMNEKYWAFEKPDSWQQAGMLINAWLFKGAPEEHIVVANVVKEVFLMRNEKRKACTGTLGFTDETFHFDIYTSEPEKDGMDEMMRKISTAAKEGKIQTSGKFGKNYFKKAKG